AEVDSVKMEKAGGDIQHVWPGGPAAPTLLAFDPDRPGVPPTPWPPTWPNGTRFTEHSYRTLSADSETGRLILFQNVGTTHAVWAYMKGDREWRSGRINWAPREVALACTPYHTRHVRVNYPNV